MSGVYPQTIQSLSDWNTAFNLRVENFCYNALVPTVANAYSNMGHFLEKQAGLYFSRPFQKKMHKLWFDPIPSSLILFFSRPLERLANFWSQRKPIQIKDPLFIDQACISIMQSIYQQVREINSLLALPDQLIEVVKKVNFDRFFQGIQYHSDEKLRWIPEIALQAKSLTLLVLDYTTSSINYIMVRILHFPRTMTLGYLEEVIQAARSHIRGHVSDIAAKRIRKRESQIRSLIVANVSQFLLSYLSALVIGTVTKTALGVSTYFALENTLHLSNMETLALRAFAGAVTVSLLWKNIYEPFFEEYYNSYNKEFDTERSYLGRFLKYYEVRHLYVPIETIKFFVPMGT